MFRCISLLSVYFMCPCVFFSVQFLFPLISLTVCLLQQRHSTDREHSGCIFSPDATRAFIYFVYVYSSECRSRFRSISFSMFTSCAHMFVAVNSLFTSSYRNGKMTGSRGIKLRRMAWNISSSNLVISGNLNSLWIIRKTTFLL